MKSATLLLRFWFCSLLSAALLGKGVAFLAGSGGGAFAQAAWLCELILLVVLVVVPNSRVATLGVGVFATVVMAYHGYGILMKKGPCGCFGAAGLSAQQEHFIAAMMSFVGYLYLLLRPHHMQSFPSNRPLSSNP